MSPDVVHTNNDGEHGEESGAKRGGLWQGGNVLGGGERDRWSWVSSLSEGGGRGGVVTEGGKGQKDVQARLGKRRWSCV